MKQGYDTVDVFAQNIRSLLDARGMTQADLSRATGIHRQNICCILAGTENVTLKTVQRIAEALDVEPFVLLWENSKISA